MVVLVVHTQVLVVVLVVLPVAVLMDILAATQ
jgi:hypothetical protein